MAIVELNSPDVVRLSGITYRQLDYWIHLGLITPMKASSGIGDPRRYSFEDLLRVRVIGQLRSKGLSLQMIRKAVKALEERWQVADPLLSGAMLAIGRDVYFAESPTELWHVLSGQGAVKSFLLVDVGALARDTEERVREHQLAA